MNVNWKKVLLTGAGLLASGVATLLANKVSEEEMKKEVAKLRSENTKMMVSLTKNNEAVEQMTANMSDAPVVVCNGIPISKRELELVCMGQRVNLLWLLLQPF